MSSIVPVRTVGGTAVATLVLGEPDEPGPPLLARVRTVELFAQQVASIIENARLYEVSERERRRGEALAEIARAVNGSLRLTDVLRAEPAPRGRAAAHARRRARPPARRPDRSRRRDRHRGVPARRAGAGPREHQRTSDSRAPRHHLQRCERRRGIRSDAHRGERRAHAGRAVALRRRRPRGAICRRWRRAVHRGGRARAAATRGSSRRRGGERAPLRGRAERGRAPSPDVGR